VECEPWPKDKAERVGLNGFGIGGANGHVGLLMALRDFQLICYQVLLESARSFLGTSVNEARGGCTPQLLVFSGTHPETVKRNISLSLDFLAKNPAKVADASYTLACRRRILSNRAYAVGCVDSWDVSPVRKAGHTDLVWVFPGQGVQYPEMGLELVTGNAIARDTIRNLDEVLDLIDAGRSWTLHGELPSKRCRLDANHHKTSYFDRNRLQSYLKPSSLSLAPQLSKSFLSMCSNL
jgi:acyl transferase domain-containing protein